MTVRNPIELLDPEARDIPGAEGYRVTPSGVVWSSRKIGHKGSGQITDQWRRLSLGVSKRGGYPIAKMLMTDGRQRTVGVHTLILETFVGPRPDGKEACHSDGNPLHCHLDNLRWDTRKSNIEDARKHGTLRTGSRHQNAKLTEADVLAIRQHRKDGLTFSRIASMFGIRKGQVSRIVHRKHWTHV